jgi:FKBP-type peptidyl-prolyl cis-trans isomerase FkpA
MKTMRFNHILLFAAMFACAESASAQTASKVAAAASTPAKKTSTAPSTAHRAVAGPTTDDEKAIYSIGLSIYGSLSQFNLSPAELDLIKRAISDAAAGKPAVDIKVWGPKIEPMMKARAAKTSAVFLTKAAAEPGAVKTPTGLIYKELRPGTGVSPSAEDKVKVNYRGTFINGREFDSSKEPVEFGLNQVIHCWTEGVQKMKVGGKARLVCPAEIAYGEQGRPGIPGGSTLIFEIELLSVAGK